MIEFGRYISVDVGRPGAAQLTRIENLRIHFRVLRDMAKTFNTADFEIYGMKEAGKALFQEKDAVVRIRAGYTGFDGAQDDIGSVFLGNVTEVTQAREGANNILKISAKDGIRALRDATIEVSFGKNYSASRALRQLVKMAGLEVDFIADVPDRPFFTGFQYAGHARKAVDVVAQRLGLEWSLQDGKVVMTAAGRSRVKSKAQAINVSPLISADTGLLGSFEKQSLLRDTVHTSQALTDSAIIKKDERKGWHFRCLLNWRIVPAYTVTLQGLSIPTATPFRVDRVLHEGDNAGPDFFSEVITSAEISK